jgi:hypothetical protein
MFKGFIAGREAERCVLPDFRVGADTIDGFLDCLDGLDAAAVRCG